MNDGLFIEYVHITLGKRGDEYAIFTPNYDQTFKKPKLLNSKLYDILLFNEINQYILPQFFKIKKNIVKAFYE